MIASRGDVLPEGLRTVDEALHRTRFRILPFLGPAFIACVAYIDPGNFATNIAGGSKFGYTLVWVIVVSNLMAMLIQTLSAKLGIATGQNLPEVCRDRFSRRTSLGLWLQAEAIAMATDLAEFLGAAVGFHLLFGFGLFPSAIITGIAAFAILALQRFGVRLLEAVIAAIVGVIGACYLGELIFSNPDLGQVGRHALIPGFKGSDSVLLAVGILGATVMPHVIYLHSALTQDRLVPETDQDARTLLRYTRVDVLIAMTIAGLINMAMLVMAASTFFGSGHRDVDSLEGAHRTLQPILGSASSTLFALALVASGLSSSAVGTLVGTGRDAGLHPEADPDHAAPARDDGARVRRDRHRSRSLANARDLAGRALVRNPVRARALVYFTSRGDVMGMLVNRKRHDRRCGSDRRGDHRAEHLPARPDRRALTEPVAEPTR